MSIINLLDKKVYNRIAAGEVVERPSSIVKECVENALDAKASSIIVEIFGGGIKKISITDNGSGIMLDDLKKAFLPHATSKIKDVEDLDSINSLGFRGEALSSIASVAQVELISKHISSEIGGKIEVNGGDFGELTEIGASQGTTITIKNVFYNVPARAKFLKSNKVEESYITNIMARFILANPTVNFKYIADGQTIYQTVGQTLKDAIFVVYGSQTVNNLLAVKYQDENLSLTGYISKPSDSKANRTYQTLVINGRYVINNAVSAAVYSAFENFLMKGKFPFFVLHLNIPFDKLDINIHPNKLDVKFENQNHIYGIVLNKVSETLLEANNTVELSLEDTKILQPETKIENLPENFGKSFSQKQPIDAFDKLEELRKTTIIAGKSFNPDNFVSKDSGILYDVMYEKQKPLDEQFKMPEIASQQSLNSDIIGFQYKVVGTVFNTYIILENSDNLFLIDQHAAHERLLFEKIKDSNNATANLKQDLLLPYVFKVNNLENNFMLENIHVFNELGFTVEEFGNLTYKIVSVPLILSSLNLKDFIDDCLSDLNYLSKNIKDLLKMLATKACKAAVKGGQKLSNNEINYLMKELIENNTQLLCPHGRPVIIKIKNSEIEKWFKRIV